MHEIDGMKPDSDGSSFEESDEPPKKNHLQMEEKKDCDNMSGKGSVHSKRSKFSQNRGYAKNVDKLAEQVLDKFNIDDEYCKKEACKGEKFTAFHVCSPSVKTESVYVLYFYVYSSYSTYNVFKKYS